MRGQHLHASFALVANQMNTTKHWITVDAAAKPSTPDCFSLEVAIEQATKKVELGKRKILIYELVKVAERADMPVSIVEPAPNDEETEDEL